MKLDLLLLVFTCIEICVADIYLHNPRGSNNRLDEKSAQRTNANRVFDSQNNNRGGYNVGDRTKDPAGTKAENQYEMVYFQSDAYNSMKNGQGQSTLSVEWTNQHGCGGNEATDPYILNCNIVLQYACQADTVTGQDKFRDGTSTETPTYTLAPSLTQNKGETQQRKNNDAKADRVLQEPWQWYDKCYLRERNQGLFTADQALKQNNGLGYSSAIYTRQNPNGDRRGYECPEERDYYPYWHPTMWKDIAVLAENSSMCSHYQSKSFNVQPYHECVEFYDTGKTQRKHFSRWNNDKQCTDNGGMWKLFYNYLGKAPEYNSKATCLSANKDGLTYIWGTPYDADNVQSEMCLIKLETPTCYQSPWTRTNHLGNGRDGLPVQFNWTLPYFPGTDNQRCVLRVRYNISTDDYDPYNTDSSMNGKRSPVQGNPYVNIGVGRSPLRLAVNTAQTGRVFQDRSHVFGLKPRPASLKGLRLYNLNVRGKRGNIVQVYPAVEYDFVPTILDIADKDAIHIQWTGSNTHNNGAPAGDGQAGNDGQGTEGTDRSNIAQILDRNYNFPVPFESSTMWSAAVVLWTNNGDTMSSKDLAIHLASSGYYRCEKAAVCQGESVESKVKMDDLLNNAPASFPGVVVRLKAGAYHFMCSRNNNFSNRSQKASIVVT